MRPLSTAVSARSASVKDIGSQGQRHGSGAVADEDTCEEALRVHLHRLLATAGRAGYFTVAIAFGDEAENLELPGGRLDGGDDRDAVRRELRTYGAVAGGTDRERPGGRPRGMVVLLVQNGLGGDAADEPGPVAVHDDRHGDRQASPFRRFLSGLRVAGEHDGDADAPARRLQGKAGNTSSS